MNKYILGGVGLLIVVFIIIFMKTDKPLAVETPAKQVVAGQTVTYTNEGFVPEMLTVKAGTMVTFINQNDSPMWVASAKHPDHKLYPEFDPKTAVPKGGSYSFTFTKVGTHPYHNHVLLGKFGKIVVE